MSEAQDCRFTRRRKPLKALLWMLGIAAGLAIAVDVVFQVSPWPAALLIRWALDEGGVNASQALEKHLPAGVSERLNEHYDSADDDAYLDVFYPSEIENSERALLTVVWVHGGAWIAGSKNQIANYARILAGKGYTVVAVDYSLAPGKSYPTPVRQVNTALGYLAQNAQRLHVDPARFVLAGDSAGAHIAAQLANAISVPSYAQTMGITPSIARSQLAGVVLFCGIYDFGRVDHDGSFQNFRNTMILRSYSGTKYFLNDAHFATASVANYVTPAFPPMFISAGNTDPLAPQSYAFARTVAALGVPVDTLFFPDNYTPALHHEYQFDLDTEAGRLALDSSTTFLSAR